MWLDETALRRLRLYLSACILQNELYDMSEERSVYSVLNMRNMPRGRQYIAAGRTLPYR